MDQALPPTNDSGSAVPLTVLVSYLVLLLILGVVSLLRSKNSEEDYYLAGRQQAILAQAAKLVKPDGRLIFSVCTVTPEETTAVAENFLQQHPEFSKRPLKGVVPGNWGPFLGDDDALHTWPHRHGLDGFYAVRFEKN